MGARIAGRRVELQLTLNDEAIRAFFDLAFSSIIITKSGGVSLALDLGHTRPHRAKWVVLPSGEVTPMEDSSDTRVPYLTKNLRSALEEFRKRYRKNLADIMKYDATRIESDIETGDAKTCLSQITASILLSLHPPTLQMRLIICGRTSSRWCGWVT